jgi:hypothetical protein
LGMIIGLLVERLGITKYCAQLAQKLSDYRASSGK